MKRNDTPKPCPHCEKPFIAPRGGKFCSGRCRTAYGRASKPKRSMNAIMADRIATKRINISWHNCDQCGKSYQVSGTNKPGGEKGRKGYCSGACRQKAYRERKK